MLDGYNGKLHPAPVTATRKVMLSIDYNGILNKFAGIIYVPVEYEGNTQSVEEELVNIIDLRRALIGLFTDETENVRPISDHDILFINPYNRQVSLLRRALGATAKVGSVDKFQGLEAPIVIISMCSSHADDSPRGMDYF